MGCDDWEEWCADSGRAVDNQRCEWEGSVDRDRQASVERFYHVSETPIYELIQWHTLVDDLSSLAYTVKRCSAATHRPELTPKRHSFP